MDVTLSLQNWTRDSPPGALQMKFKWDIDDPLQSLVEACNSSLLPLSNVENFVISAQDLHSFNTEGPQCLEVLRQFSAAKSLSLGSMHIVRPVVFVLKRVIEEGMTDVLPAIQKLSVSGSLPAGSVQEAMEQFVAARGLPTLEACFL
jgi:hypothetical protein